MSYIGDFRLGDTFDLKFTTRQISGAPATLAGTPVISAYVGNSTTQITAGITLTVDFDAVTGLNNVRVVASGANGYATASNYQLVITTGTVNSVSVVGEVIGQFSIEARSAVMPTTGGRTLVVDANGLADANMVKMGPTGSGTAQTARDVGTSVLLSAGTGTGQLDFTSGVVKSSLVQILGTALTETAGQIAAAFKQFFDVGTPTGTMKAITNVVTATNLTNLPAAAALEATLTAMKGATYAEATDSLEALRNRGDAAWATATGFATPTNITAGTITTVTNLTNAPTAGDFTATMKTSIGTAVAASAVASVTGNVGGNVTGTVAGVTPATAAQVAAVLTTQITEAYRANGAAPTLAQFMSEVLAHLGEVGISGTTKTINKLDHTTAAETFTLDSATDPSTITRAT